MVELFFDFFIQLFANDWLQNALSTVRIAAESNSNLVFGIDMSIEGMRSRNYSVAIFVLLILSLIFFSVIIYLYLPKGAKKLKTGEKVMFGSLIAGIIIAIIIGYVQLIEGYLL